MYSTGKKKKENDYVYVGEEECSKDIEKENRACGFHTGHTFFGQIMISLPRLQTKTFFRNHCCTRILDKILSQISCYISGDAFGTSVAPQF